MAKDKQSEEALRREALRKIAEIKRKQNQDKKKDRQPPPPKTAEK